MLNGRKRTASFLATLCITALSGSVLASSPTFADPDATNVQDAKERVHSLYEQAEQASERYNDARIELKRAKTRLHALQADLRRQQEKVDAVRTQVARAVVAQYQGQALSSTTQVLLAKDPQKFLDQLATISGFNDQQAEMMAGFAVQAKQLEMRKAAAQRELDRIAETEKTLADEKATIDQKASEAKDLLDRLEARAAARVSRSSERTAPTPTVSASGNAGAAINYALAQVGDAYVYGASGPNAFDCSGLTMMAWAQGGVGLPHSSSAQFNMGTPVSSSQLQPGDLVFYYSPVSHVGIYIGNGQIVHAANPSTGVQVAGVFSMPFTGARRVG
ncbi:MAG: NlpC/P60 family protein [Nocardioides sp.]